MICDYLDENQSLKPFYHRFPKLENFKLQVEEKQLSVRAQSRTILVTALKNQYQGIKISKFTSDNINALQHDTTFTVTTGHQLNLFTGPLYFFYKIVSTINLCKELKTSYPEYNFVPIYWMATEDHDFEEINYFNFNGKKIQWNRPSSGAVGELDLQGLDDVFKVFAMQLGLSANAKELKQLFQEAYLEQSSLTNATRVLVNALFSETGLVIVDGNDAHLKRLFIPYIKNELVNQTSFKEVATTSQQLNSLTANYKVQVNPREINLFYLNKNLRERIVEVDGVYSVYGTNITWTKETILKEVDEFPERFSPNVILRPLYQEVILPNICYIGGGGEIAYWLQLKSNFEAQQVPFPIVLLRNSALIVTEKQKEKLQKLNVSVTDLFLNQQDLITKVTKQISSINIDFSEEKTHLKKQFEHLHSLAEHTDKSFKSAVSAQEVKQIKGLENLEKRLLKAQKRKLEDVLERVRQIQDELFPGQSLQERNANFSQFYLEYGSHFTQVLLQNLQPLKAEFLILTV